jgi:polysaccharide export outer membrane protein
MKSRKYMGIALLSTALVTAGCGITYHSPSVKEASAGVAVREIPLTAQSVLAANQSAYSPKRLPAAFYQTAGGGSLRFGGPLPEEPFVPEETRGALQLRPPPQILPQTYRIGVGDVVLLATKSVGSTVEELSGLLAAQNRRQGYTVRDDGRIAIPEIGQIDIAGLTVEEAEARIFEVLVRNQIDPAFSLEVSDFNSQRVAIGGAVGNSTLIPITLKPLTLGEALTSAGGIQLANDEFGSIRIYRSGTLYQIPVKDYFEDPALQRRVLLDGDAVYVDTTYDLQQALAFYQQRLDVIAQRTQARAQALAELETEVSLRRAALVEQRTNFESLDQYGAVERDYVYLTGEVAKQSRFALPFGQTATLADALYDSGGYNNATGSSRHIYVLRASNNPAEFGAVTAWHLDATNAVNLTLAARMEMRPDDIIFIEEQPVTKWGRSLQQTFGLVGAAVNTARAAGN